MRLKRLELFGFKSFADRTTLDFPHALTGVVGPNGCGKSNVVDAIRWVLGETRPTSMRGAEMTDVIFKGSTSRPALGVAEVTIVLDNECGTIPAHGSEVAVTRRVYRSGDGEYEIDGSKVRLKDVRDVLFDTGLGSRGYSVLEQGRIDAVLSANPVDRRSIFEEAAGVSRFRQRRKETESRLKRVDQDLSRIDDVVGELESRVRSLKIQAGKARSWIEVRDAWREKGVRLAQNQLHRYSGELAAAAEDLEALDRRVSELREQREQAEAEMRSHEAEQRERALQVDAANEALAAVAGELSTLEERARQLAERVQAWEESAESEERRVAELRTRSAERSAELETAQADRQRLVTESERAEAALEELGGTYREAARRYREAREQSEEQSKQVNALIADKAAAFNSARQLEQSLGPLSERAERAEGRLSELRESVEQARLDRTASEGLVAEAEREVETLDSRRNECASQLERLNGEEREARDEERRVEVERAALKSRVEALLDWERERETLDAGVRALLDEERTDRPVDGFSGLLADRIRTQPEFARALDAALGQAAESIVMAAPHDALAIGRWLKSQEIGQARLIAPNGLNRGTCEPAIPELPIDLREHVHGLLLEVVEVEADLIPVAHLMLCDCILVSDLDAALDLTEELPGWRLVTPEGDLVDSTGVLTGYREVGQGAVGRRAQAAELEEREGVLEQEALRLEAVRVATAGRREAAESDLATISAQLESARAAFAEAVAGRRSAAARVGDAERALEVGESESVGLIEERDNARTRLQELQEEHERVERSFALENERLEELERTRHTIESERDEAGREEQRARIELTRVREQSQGVERRLGDLSRSVEELEREIERACGLVTDNRERAERGGAEQAELTGQRSESEQRREAANTELEEKRAAERAGREAIDVLRQANDEVTGALEGAMGERGQRQLDQQRAELARGEILRRAEDDFKLDHETLERLFDPEEDLLEAEHREALEEEVGELKRKLDRLGPVNLEAVDELEEVGQRLAFMTEQRADLIDSKSQLTKTLATINEESERLFVETFDEIREHFRTIFRQLFGGGKADVELAEDEPVLEAGIEITARPPGRETLPIGLLSGGQRTMTALALLFAVFKSRPSPFCVLDEVDAALDDANVGRFLGMLDGFLDLSQFIVVTHNKGTMNACDMLYGVTMETKGVSRNVAVELSDVDGFVPEATGNVGAAEAARSETAEVEAEGEDSDGDEEGAEDAPDEPVVELAPVARREEVEAKADV
ncbi:MAG: chromosome segregation protein SMC [Planctomycetota bacterium]|jgi:chromosome segregation protein